jgi:hypothetical protein
LQFVALPLRLTSFSNHIHGAFPGLSRSLDELRSVQSSAPNSKLRPAKMRHATMAVAGRLSPIEDNVNPPAETQL